MPDTPATCQCGSKFTVTHAMICHMGGFPTICHNEVCDFIASLRTEVCHNVVVESILQALLGEPLTHQSANVNDCAHADIRVRGF